MKETELLFLKADKAKQELGWVPKIDFQTCLKMINEIEAAKTKAGRVDDLYKQQIRSYFTARQTSEYGLITVFWQTSCIFFCAQ